MTGDQMREYYRQLVGKQCPVHPHKIIKWGKWGTWCGEKDDLGRWCDGGPVSKEYIKNLPKSEVEKSSVSDPQTTETLGKNQ